MKKNKQHFGNLSRKFVFLCICPVRL